MKLSLVIPVRKATSTLVQTVESMKLTCAGLDAEIIVAYSTGDETAATASRLTGVRLLPTEGKRSIPQLRRDGVRAAQGDLVLITEDHCTVEPNWVSTLLREAERNPATGWGGPVRNGRKSWLGWAQYLTRYTAFLPPGKRGPITHLPGNNAMYKREHLLALAHLWDDGFWEAELNEVLRLERGPFWYVPEAAVFQQQRRGLFEYVSLRYRHGRCYGARRGKPHSALFFFVAALLFWRGFRNCINNGEGFQFCAVSPLLAIYHCAWAAGETAGYLAGAGLSCGDTD